MTHIAFPDAGVEAPVLELEGDEELGCLPRFVASFRAAAVEVGASAELALGGRRIRCVVLELELRGDTHHAVLAPHAALLSMSRRSRVFERLSTPAIVEVVAAGHRGVRVEMRLRETYAPRPWTVQHRESDLDFVLRLLEREGITLLVADDGTLVLCDDNAGLPSGEALAAPLRRTSKLLPHRVELLGGDAEIPLRAAAIVSETGVGELEIHDEPFATPEEADRAARLCAERLRCRATLLHAVASEPVAPGRAADVVVVRVHHELRAGAFTATVTAVPAATPFRPERRTAEPRVTGLLPARVATRDPGAPLRDAEGRYRIRDAGFDRSMPLGADVELREGTRILWGCLDGDPERAIITGAIADAEPTPGVSAWRTPGGATVEMSSRPSPSLGESEGVLAHFLPEVGHHATDMTTTVTVDDGDANTDDETRNTDTWMRMGVPHSKGADTTRKWTYFRLGEAAINTQLSVTEGTFNESQSQCLALNLNAYTADGLAGVFDFTDYNRTVLTKGNWEEIVQGEGRFAVHGGQTAPNYELRFTPERTEEKVSTPKYAIHQGTTMEGYSGMKIENVLGAKLESAVGGKIGADIGFMAQLTAGYKMDAVFADSWEYRRGEELGSSSTIDQRARDSIQFSVHAGHGSPNWEMALAFASAVIATSCLTTDPEDLDDEKTTLGATLGIALAVAAARAVSVERDLEDGNPILSLDKNKKIAVLRSDDWLLMMSPDYAVLGKNKKYEQQKKVANLTKDDTTTGIVIEEGAVIRLQAPSAAAEKAAVDTAAAADAAAAARDAAAGDAVALIPAIAAANIAARAAAAAANAAKIMASIEIKDRKVVIKADEVTIKGAAGPNSKVTITGPVEIDGDVTIKKKLTVKGEGCFENNLKSKSGSVTLL